MFKKRFMAGNRIIGSGRPFIIAEIGSNHNQNLRTAEKLIDVATEAGADAVKFQAIAYDELYSKGNNKALKGLFKKIKLSEQWYERLSKYCGKRNILFSAAATYLRAVDNLEKMNVKFHKIASPQTIAFPQLIRKAAETGKPVIMSTGYCTLRDIDRAVRIVKGTGNRKLALLHCISEYPTKAGMVKLGTIRYYKERYNLPVGFSDHTLGWGTALAAVSAGADIIEKHITLSRAQNGPDHYFALEPDEFKAMVKDIRTVEKAISGGIKSKITKNENRMIKKLRMKAVAGRDIEEGDMIDQQNDIVFRRDSNGMDAWDVNEMGRIIALKEIKNGEPITYKCVRNGKRR